MEDRPYSEMDRVNPFPQVHSSPLKIHHEEGLAAVQLAHKDQIDDIARALNHGQSVLVICDKALAEYVLGALEQHPKLRATGQAGAGATGRTEGAQWDWITYSGSPTAAVIPHLVQNMAERLRDVNDQPNRIAVARHLDLMMHTADDRARPEVNDILFWLAEFSASVKLFFWDPLFTLPAVVQAAFPNRVTIRGLKREVLWRLLSSQEARKFSPDSSRFTVAAQSALYQYLSGTSVVELRRIMRSVVEHPFLDLAGRTPVVNGELPIPTEALLHVRALTGITPPVPSAEVSGYDALKSRLQREVVFPIKLRLQAADAQELQRADRLAQRGIVLHGPPGTGKTELAKWLANQLDTPLFVIHGPELKSKFVGETEAALRRLIDQARRNAPSAILIDELDALTAARDEQSTAFETSVVNTLLTEMDGMRAEESVLFIGTTNRIEALDPGFCRPGRFGLRILVDYPEEADRRAILELYGERFMLKLTDDSVSHLATLTNGRSEGRFSGDHLRAICQFLSRESLYDPTGVTNPNDPAFQKTAVESVRATLQLPGRRQARGAGSRNPWGERQHD